MNPTIKEVWFEVGVLLELPVAKLQNIKEVHGNDLNSSCMMMLIEWSLKKSATWENLLSVIDRIIDQVPFKSGNTLESSSIVNVTLDHFRKDGKAMHVKLHVNSKL